MGSRAARLALQLAGRGRMEAHPEGDPTGARYEGRFVIYSISDDGTGVFGGNVSLFDPDAAAKYGVGPQSAHLVAVRSGCTVEGFDTSSAELVGHTIGRATTEARWKVYFDANPDGTRSFDDRASFVSGHLVATYSAEEFFQVDPRAGILETRVDYVLLESEPFDFRGNPVDFGALAPRMTELTQGHAPEPDPNPEAVPDVEPFSALGPGTFTNHFPVAGTVLSVD